NPEVIADAVAHIPPLQHGDLQALGLCHWTPAGLVQYSFELVHVFTGLPWFYTFIAATLLWRAVIFPFAVVGTRASQRLRPYSQRMAAAQAQMQASRLAGDTVAMQQATLTATKLRNEAGVSMKQLMAPMIQLPISLGMFIGIRKMCDLPVLQLTQSGFAWLPDLTQPGPYYILPILVAASGNLMISMGRRDMDPSRPGVGHAMNGFRLLTILTIPWLNTFSSGLLLSLLVTSASAVLQTGILRVPAVRSAFGIPPWTPMPGGEMPTVMDTYR
ncbi:60Kd inner membrane protein-domain-containing protein, partial [Mycena belliarum]